MDRPVILDCRNLWKIYGSGVEAFLRRSNGQPDPEGLARAGLIGAVQGASVSIRQGEIFVIMGLSGSGKSTLVRLLSRLIEPSAGELLYEGRNLLSLPARELIEIRRRKMGMVFQHFALLPHLTALENVAFPLDIQGVPRPEREARAREVLALVGLEGREANYPRELSGGQQQRVGIARSLAVGPELWFLDEPFSALDPLIRREMQDEFLRIQAMLHKTIVFITHDFDEAIRLADRIAIMQDGRIVQIARPEELVLNPATDYVAQFTRNIPRAKVLTAATVMQPGPGPGSPAGQVQGDARIESIAAQVVASDQPFAVMGPDGQVIGRLDRARVIDVLVGNPLQHSAGGET